MADRRFKNRFLVVAQWLLLFMAQVVITGVLWLFFMFLGTLITGQILMGFNVHLASNLPILWMMLALLIVCYTTIWSLIWSLVWYNSSANSTNLYGQIIAATLPLVIVCILFHPTPSDASVNSMTILDMPDQFYFACALTGAVMFVLFSCVLRHLFRIKKRWAVTKWGIFMVIVGFILFLCIYRLEPILYLHT